MKPRKVDATLDKQMLIGMVTSDKYLKQVIPIYKPEFLKTNAARLVADWCVTYFEKYDIAPKLHIQDIFQSNKRNGLDDSTCDQIEQMLATLSDEYERSDKFNADYLLDKTEEMFRSRNLEMLAEDIKTHLMNGNIEDAELCYTDYQKIERTKSQGIDPFLNMDALRESFESREEPLFKLPGAIGQMLNSHLIREGFIAFLGRAKIGKTWFLQLLAMQALKDKCNVAFFQTGDLSQNDFMVRFGVYMAKKSNDRRYCGDINIPVLDCMKNQTCECGQNKTPVRIIDGALIEDWLGEMENHIVCTKCSRNHDFQGATWYTDRPKVEPLNWREAYRAIQEWYKRHKVRRFKLSTHSSTSVTTKDICAQLDAWETFEGFVPDVIVIDYADIMAPEDARKEHRHQENDRWKALRKLSQDRKVLVITATQTNRGGFNVDNIQESDTGEDKRKMDHVTAFFGFNQNDKEKDEGILRVSTLLAREGKFSKSNQICVLQSLETGTPLIASYWQNKKSKKNK